MIVRTFDGLQALTTPQPTWSNSSQNSLHLYGLHQAYFDIFRTQPNVRICVEFLARNVAHVAPQVFRRVSDTDRVRLVDHDLATWLGSPNPATTRFRLFEALMTDLGIYDCAYWLKVRHLDRDGRDAIGLVRLPPEEMTVKGGLLPTEFVWTANGRERRFAPSEIVHFAGYRLGISPLETLRRILAEEQAAGDHREGFWRNAARHEGVIERELGDPTAKWTKEQKNDWREQWQARHTGSASGQVALLEPGWTFKAESFSAKDSEYTAGGKLRREVCAAVYQIPQPFVGILDHATFSNIKEQHKNLYQDCLGPWFEMLRQELHRQLLVECADTQDVYVEFNIDVKLAGTPDDRASSMQISIGRPWRTVNEGRALDNLPRIDDPALDTVAPQQGGPSDATAKTGKPAPMMTRPGADPGDEAELVAPVLHAARRRQQARLGKLAVSERATAFFADVDRWNRELTDDLARAGVEPEHAGHLALEANRVTLTTLLAQEAS
ncbi:MAG: phage portal protein [Vicinamibacterales bacterium]